MSLLGLAGFDLYQSDPDNLTSQLSRLTSPILSPLAHAEEDDSSIHLLDLSASTSITPENGAVLTRSRSSTDASAKSTSSSPVHFHNGAEPATPDRAQHSGDKQTHTRSQSHSPSGSDVRVLDPDLTCIGLSDDNADMWGLKIVKLVAFPDLILPTPSTSSPTMRRRRRSLNPSDLVSVASLGVQLESSVDLSCASEDGTPFPSESESDTVGCVDTPCIGELDKDCRASSESPIFDLDAEGRPWDEVDGDEDAEDSSEDDDSAEIITPVRLQDKAFPGSPRSAKLRRRDLPHYDSDKTVMSRLRLKRRPERRSSRTSQMTPPPPLVPFFSFTRTPEGSSLTAPVSLLAALFPACERHMVICSGELDMLDSRAASPMRHMETPEIEEHGNSEVLPEAEGTLRCLQIDLRRFGLGMSSHARSGVGQAECLQINAVSSTATLAR